MKKIPLPGGMFTLVDDEDYDYLMQWKWHLSTDGYAFRTTSKDGKRVSIIMHRLINQTPKGGFTDHINRIKLDNQKQNLRTVTRSQNAQNVDRYTTRHSSIYKGVKRRPRCWEVWITVKGKQVYIGTFKNERHAALAYDIWAKDVYGDYAVLNFLGKASGSNRDLPQKR